MHEWISDNGLTPQLIVDTSRPGVEVPAGYAEDGRIILNVSWSATARLELGNDEIRFEARFGGTPHRVRVPVDAVIGIYARESSQGMIFAPEPDPAGGDGDEPPDPSPAPPARPTLKVVR